MIGHESKPKPVGLVGDSTLQMDLIDGLGLGIMGLVHVENYVHCRDSNGWAVLEVLFIVLLHMGKQAGICPFLAPNWVIKSKMFP